MKERITVTVDKEVLKLLDNKVDDKTFGTRSHALEFLMQQRKELEKTKKE